MTPTLWTPKFLHDMSVATGIPPEFLAPPVFTAEDREALIAAARRYPESDLIASAARATEVFTEDELEEYARKDYPESLRKP